MMKPGIGTYERFRRCSTASKAGKRSSTSSPTSSPPTRAPPTKTWVNLALWLKANNFQARPGADLHADPPMAMATTMYHSGQNPLRKGCRPGSGRWTRRIGPPAPAPQGPAALPTRGLAAGPRGLRAMGRGDLIGASPRATWCRDQPVVLDRGAAGGKAGPGAPAQVGRQVRQPGGLAPGRAGPARRRQTAARAFLRAGAARHCGWACPGWWVCAGNLPDRVPPGSLGEIGRRDALPGGGFRACAGFLS